MVRKKTQEEIEEKLGNIKRFASDKGYEFIKLESDNKKNRNIVHIKDCNYSYTIELRNLLNCAKPQIVSSSNPYSTKNIIKFIELNRKYTYSHGEYINKSTPVYCVCHKCGETFNTTWDSISSNRGCPYCRGLKVCAKNSFIINYPDFAKEIDFDKTSIDVNLITIGSGREIWFKCFDCNKSYKSDARSRRDGHGCPICGVKRRSGENSPRWNGGISEICEYLRSSVDPWKFATIKYYNGKCVICGKTSERIVHHLNVPFINIVNTCFDELNINIKRTIAEYSYSELKSLQDLCLQKHYDHGFGVVINRKLHEKFHSIYGNKNNTRYQFIDYAKSLGDNTIECKLENIVNDRHIV